ncbi:iron-containing redox enzyme family protein, partial [Streptomyces rubiginosohelvolus]
MAIVDEITSWLTAPAEEFDRALGGDRERIVAEVSAVNAAAAGTGGPADHPTAEGSALLHEVTRMLERATIGVEDAHLEPGILDQAPADPKQFLSWLKGMVRGHRAYKHPYYTEFINRDAQRDDLRTYVIQESLIDGRFDDFLAMMQIGTAGASKMEIANNYWDEMGNGDPEAVHTHLFNKIYE